MLACLHPQIGQGKTPRPGAEKSVNVEAHLRHAGYASRQGDEGADHRQQAGDKNRGAAEAGEEAVADLQLPLGEPHQVSVAQNQPPPTEIADPISQRRADIASDGARGCHPQQGETSLRNQVSRERHDHFRRQRNAGRFDAHQQHDSRITAAGNHGDDEMAEDGKNFRHHYAWPPAC